ncbi:MAG: DUF1007 family protein [Campylobacterales bacterium]|nr:DUF1007 family protein [Campylobacterales bacterium]
MAQALIHLWLFWLALTPALYGCATCMAMTPMTEVGLTLQCKGAHLERIDFVWRFSMVYTDEIVYQYDRNRDGTLDDQELSHILKLKLEYMQPRSMLTTLKLARGDEPERDVALRYEDFALRMEGTHLQLEFNAVADLSLYEGDVLMMAFTDEGGFFDFRTQSIDVLGTELPVQLGGYLFTATVAFEAPQNTPTEANATAAPAPQPQNLLERTIESMRDLMVRIKQEHSMEALWTLLLFAYMYGFVHAMGPGHGKALVGSYFVGNERSIMRALWVALGIGTVHTFSAFALTLIVYTLLGTLLSSVMENIVRLTTVISALLIIAIALWLIIRKIRALRAKPVLKFSAAPQSAFSLHVSAPKPHLSSCGCNACKVDPKSTDLALIISAGIIPCPGTVTLFIFALSQGLYAVGSASALSMSLGMSSVIFGSAALGSLLRRGVSTRFARLKTALEFISLGVILVLGLALLAL